MKHIMLNILTYIFKISLKFFYFTLSKTNDYVILDNNYYLTYNSKENTWSSFVDILGLDCPNLDNIRSYEKNLIKTYNIKTKYRCNNCGEIFNSKNKLNKFGCEKCC